MLNTIDSYPSNIAEQINLIQSEKIKWNLSTPRSPKLQGKHTMGVQMIPTLDCFDIQAILVYFGTVVVQLIYLSFLLSYRRLNQSCMWFTVRLTHKEA